MDCGRIDLVGYQFGLLPEADRTEVEGHLRACGACLDAYLALKRHADGAPDDSRPSDVARARLRHEVARTFARPRLSVGWLVQPIPLYQGLLMLSLGLVIVATTLHPSLHPRAAVPVVLDRGLAIDTARPKAESVNLY
jgi:anti-sigma factor RsiW